MISHHVPIKFTSWILQVHWLKRPKTANFQMFHCTAVIWCSLGQSSINSFVTISSEQMRPTNMRSQTARWPKLSKSRWGILRLHQFYHVLSNFPTQSEPVSPTTIHVMSCDVTTGQFCLQDSDHNKLIDNWTCWATLSHSLRMDSRRAKPHIDRVCGGEWQDLVSCSEVAGSSEKARSIHNFGDRYIYIIHNFTMTYVLLLNAHLIPYFPY